MATTKTWYRINKNVEYSTDFDFFLKNQISFVQKDITKFVFYSRLENKFFAQKSSCLRSANNYKFTDEEILEFCREIHKEILEGKHGQGKLVA